MALNNFGFIVTGKGLDPGEHTQTMQSPHFRMTTIGVERPEQGPAAARRLVAEGVQLIELCGGFGPIWTARVIDAIEGVVPIGAVGYGPEATAQLYELFA